MDILILGGTRFLGRHLVDVARADGHRVTLFHRGQTGAELFPDTEHVLGDRRAGLAALAGRRFDAVIDTCGFFPRDVRRSAQELRGAVGHYAFVSSISAYADGMPAGYAEDAALGTLADPETEELTGATYGPLKAACEREVEAAFPKRALQVRLGLIVGPDDYTDRFPYWARRLARGGEVLAPGVPHQPLQLVDVRDAAAWTLHAAVAGATGAFNVTGPAAPLTLGGFLEQGRAAFGGDTSFTWVDSAFLLERGVVPWSELPLWMPEESNFLSAGIVRARAAGLVFRPLAETLRDTEAWDRGRSPEARRGQSTLAASPSGASLDPARERELLQAWAARA